MKKRYIIILASIFLGTLVLLYSLNSIPVVASSSSSAECYSDSDCYDGERWCSSNKVLEGECDSGQCNAEINDNCNIPAGGTCVEDGEGWATCEYEPECTTDSDCAYSEDDSYCDGDYKFVGYCNSYQQCKISQTDCDLSSKICVKPAGEEARCEYQCTENSDCDSNQICKLSTHACVNAEFKWSCSSQNSHYEPKLSTHGFFSCSNHNDLSNYMYRENNYLEGKSGTFGGYSSKQWDSSYPYLNLYLCFCEATEA